MITEFITTGQAIRNDDGTDFVAPTGYSIKLEDSTYVHALPKGLHVKVYDRLLRNPSWLTDRTSVLEVILRGSFYGDIPALQGHVGQGVRHRQAYATLISKHGMEGQVVLTIRGGTLSVVNRLYSDIMDETATWAY